MLMLWGDYIEKFSAFLTLKFYFSIFLNAKSIIFRE